MEGERQTLVLESDSPVSGDGGFEPLTSVQQLFRCLVMPADLSRGVAALESVKSRNRQARLAEDRVYALDRSPADQSERAAGSVVQLANESMQIVLESHLRRGRRQIRQRSVDVEEERPARLRRGKTGRTGWTGAGAAGTELTVTVAPASNGSFHSARRGCRVALKERYRYRAAGSSGFAASAAGGHGGALSPRRAASAPPTGRR